VIKKNNTIKNESVKLQIAKKMRVSCSNTHPLHIFNMKMYACHRILQTHKNSNKIQELLIR